MERIIITKTIVIPLLSNEIIYLPSTANIINSKIYLKNNDNLRITFEYFADDLKEVRFRTIFGNYVSGKSRNLIKLDVEGKDYYLYKIDELGIETNKINKQEKEECESSYSFEQIKHIDKLIDYLLYRKNGYIIGDKILFHSFVKTWEKEAFELDILVKSEL
jgi:hypothetical protein